MGPMKIVNPALLLLISFGLACTPDVTPPNSNVEQREDGGRFYREGLRGVDLSRLPDDRRELVLEVLNGGECDCGCGMNLAECLVTDDNCDRGPSLGRMVVDAAERGKDESTLRETLLGALSRAAEQPEKEPSAEISLEGSPVRGDASAPVTIVVFSDFQCPFSRRAQPILRQALDEFSGSVKLVHKHLPLPLHENARTAALAAEAAHQQGRFWEMHDMLFRQAGALDRESLTTHARSLGLDAARFLDAMDGSQAAERVDRDAADAERIEATKTPTILVNGTRLRNYQLDTLRAGIRQSLLQEGS